MLSAPNKKTIDELDNSGTLFDEAFEETASSTPIEVVYGVALDLNERDAALHAIDTIYAQRNRARGFNSAQQVAPYRLELSTRYANPDQIGSALARIADSKHSELQYHVDKLTKLDELYAAGMGYDASDQAVEETNQEIRRTFGEDTKYRERQKTLRTIDRATKKRLKPDA